MGRQKAGGRVTVKVLHRDCLDYLTKDGAWEFDFVFADPPFNIGHPYKGFVDRRDDYPAWTRRWVRACWASCGGVMCLHGPDDVAKLYLGLEDRLGLRRVAWVNWHYRFGQCGRGGWIDARCHCLVYAKKKRFTWNPDAVLVESDRATKYNDPRIHETENGGRRLPGTVWGVPSDGPYWGRVNGNSRERRGTHPNQLPEVYLARLLRAYTNPGDWCFDPFCGSGTTAVVCKALGRSCITTDVSADNAASARQRLAKGAVRL